MLDAARLLSDEVLTTGSKLFYFDAGPSHVQGQEILPLPSDGISEDQTFRQGDAPAWEDSDDERIMVSLASVPRLRKLRKFEGEDMVNGKEYIRRLRRQYATCSWLRLRHHPTNCAGISSSIPYLSG